MALGYACVTADGIELIGDPYNQYDVECSCGIIEELRHNSLHACNRRYIDIEQTQSTRAQSLLTH